jgi:YHS domain-containing protein
MEWLSENWLLVLLIGGALVLMFRRGGIGGGMGCCGMGAHDAHHGSQKGSNGSDATSEARPVDPVSSEPVSSDGAIASVYRGRVFRFASRENRDRFEAEPERFVAPQVADRS